MQLPFCKLVLVGLKCIYKLIVVAYRNCMSLMFSLLLPIATSYKQLFYNYITK